MSDLFSFWYEIYCHSNCFSQLKKVSFYCGYFQYFFSLAFIFRTLLIMSWHGFLWIYSFWCSFSLLTPSLHLLPNLQISQPAFECFFSTSLSVTMALIQSYPWKHLQKGSGLPERVLLCPQGTRKAADSLGTRLLIQLLLAFSIQVVPLTYPARLCRKGQPL